MASLGELQGSGLKALQMPDGRASLLLAMHVHCAASVPRWHCSPGPCVVLYVPLPVALAGLQMAVDSGPCTAQGKLQLQHLLTHPADMTPRSTA